MSTQSSKIHISSAICGPLEKTSNRFPMDSTIESFYESQKFCGHTREHQERLKCEKNLDKKYNSDKSESQKFCGTKLLTEDDLENVFRKSQFSSTWNSKDEKIEKSKKRTFWANL